MESREEVRAWRERWATVNSATEQEHLATDVTGRLRLPGHLYIAFPSAEGRSTLDEEGVWLRMQALRHAYRANH